MTTSEQTLTVPAGTVYSDGWQPPAGGTLDVTSPATGEVLTTVGRASPADIADAVRRAHAAQPGWAGSPATGRAAILRRAGQLLTEHRADVAGWLIREGGAVPAKAGFEIDSALDELWAASALP
ncbi:aldehyde dehydrogenase family protein, partial [Micromonospora sp. KC207]|uniref:aldehyde dehydrogenase family protein n=1 Tax=Micromonospora sp. KC207 TaxID=2530377 RepID=UPI001045D1F7